jgi:hypothetical protein
MISASFCADAMALCNLFCVMQYHACECMNLYMIMCVWGIVCVFVCICKFVVYTITCFLWVYVSNVHARRIQKFSQIVTLDTLI